jgi:hypothetical protein
LVEQEARENLAKQEEKEKGIRRGHTRDKKENQT